jgi:hypothetical protein
VQSLARIVLNKIVLSDGIVCSSSKMVVECNSVESNQMKQKTMGIIVSYLNVSIDMTDLLPQFIKELL